MTLYVETVSGYRCDKCGCWELKITTDYWESEDGRRFVSEHSLCECCGYEDCEEYEE